MKFVLPDRDIGPHDIWTEASWLGFTAGQETIDRFDAPFAVGPLFVRGVRQTKPVPNQAGGDGCASLVYLLTFSSPGRTLNRYLLAYTTVISLPCLVATYPLR